jgi:hypothetical protein
VYRRMIEEIEDQAWTVESRLENETGIGLYLGLVLMHGHPGMRLGMIIFDRGSGFLRMKW